MNHLILMRHAKAEAGAPGGDDHERALTDTGRSDAARIAEALWKPPLRPHHAFVSTSTRTRQTWEIVAERFEDDILQTEFLPELYNADMEALDRVLQRAFEQSGCVAIVGHNPGIHMLAVQILHDNAASPYALEQLARGFPPGAAAVFEADAAERLTFTGFLAPSVLR